MAYIQIENFLHYLSGEMAADEATQFENSCIHNEETKAQINRYLKDPRVKKVIENTEKDFVDTWKRIIENYPDEKQSMKMWKNIQAQLPLYTFYPKDLTAVAGFDFLSQIHSPNDDFSLFFDEQKKEKEKYFIRIESDVLLNVNVLFYNDDTLLHQAYVTKIPNIDVANLIPFNKIKGWSHLEVIPVKD